MGRENLPYAVEIRGDMLLNECMQRELLLLGHGFEANAEEVDLRMLGI